MTEQGVWSRRLATWFGCGLSPIAPGTMGSLGALPLHLLLRRLGPIPHLAAIAAVTIAGIQVADETAAATGEEDPQIVVIDEVAGALIAMGLVKGRGITRELLALALFRLFDIVKPGPIASAEHMKPAGLGIMADDLLAGFVAGLVARALG